MENEIQANNKSNSKVVVAILLILVVLLGGYIVYEKFISGESTVEETEKTNDSSKKGYVYDTNYTYDVSKESYFSEYSLDYVNSTDLVVPYINLNSDDAKKVNKELEYIYKKAMEYYEAMINDGNYLSLNYVYFENNGILSVVVKESHVGGNNYGINANDYFTYNFEIKTGKKLSFEETIDKFGYTRTQVDTKMYDAIRTHVESRYSYDGREGTIEELKNGFYEFSKDYYEKSIKNNNISFYVLGNKLIIIPMIQYGGGQSDFVKPIVLIEK